MNELFDDKILENFQKGDPHAFQQIFKHFYKSLHYFTYKLTSNREEAEDIVLTTFSKLFKRCEHFATEVNIKAFLFITARNNSLDYLRTIKWQREQQKEFATIMRDETFLQYEYEINDELLELIRTAINDLPAECRKIFKMIYFEGMKPAKIAETLNISVNTVYVQKSRALNMLRVALAEHPMLIAAILSTTLYLHTLLLANPSGLSE